ncbi:hypothetical protein [Xenorhabdus stockiae]|uniref:hypothetical protein n=1 Tax=Xenorhabdus stockiae TaxID=351614 RepID=UPI004062E9E7
MLKTKKILFATILLLILSGCESLNESVLNEKKSIRETAYDYAYKKYGAVDRLVLPLPKPILENNVYHFQTNIPHFKFTNQEIITFNNYLKRECFNMNGTMNDSWCVNNEKPLFYASISKGEIIIKEPVDKNSISWHSYAKEVGFKSNREIAEKKFEQYKNEIKLNEYIKTLYNKTLSSETGTMVCKTDPFDHSAFYIGYIDSKERNKIKVLIIKKGIEINQRIAEIKIEQKLIWDDIKNWYVCNYKFQY